MLGVQSPGDELKIRNLRRIKRVEETMIGLFDGKAGPVLREVREVPLNAWTGETENGLPVHLAFRFGELTIAVDLPTPDGGLQELTVLRWKPRLALGVATPWERPNGNDSKACRVERARLAETCAELSEIRAINGKAQIFGETEVRGWLEQHNRRFVQLSDRGLAGGKLRFRIIDLVQAAA